MSSGGNRNEDLTAVRAVRTAAPNVQILLIGVTGEEAEFLQCVRAGVRGNLLTAASADDVVEGIRSLQDGKTICPGTLCASLFRHMERDCNLVPFRERSSATGIEAARIIVDSVDCRGPHTNKEIANRFCLWRANGEEPPVSHEAQNRRGGWPGHRASSPHARLHAIACSFGAGL
jgi:DNA-binding NarL/FixJ family response regulator